MRTGDLHVDHAVDVGEIEDGEVRLESSTSREQLVALLDRYERPLFSFLSVLLADRAAAEDCVQDTFLRAYEHLQRRREVTGTWLYRVRAGVCTVWTGTTSTGLRTAAFARGHVSVLATTDTLSSHELVAYVGRSFCSRGRAAG
jgi:hypothetical protein